MITTVLFDLDGTLLPMDNDVFTKAYFKLLAQTVAPLGYEPEPLVNAVWAGTAAMVKNDGSRTNEAAFWNKFCETYGEKGLRDKPHFDAFYKDQFQQAKSVCGYTPLARQCVGLCKSRGLKTVLATNPLFPKTATRSRISWAGLDESDFLFYTTYENIGFCKPNLAYYREVAQRAGSAPEECLMVGNDADEDLVAEGLGMRVFLLTDHLLNKSGRDVSRYPQGGFNRLLSYIEAL